MAPFLLVLAAACKPASAHTPAPCQTSAHPAPRCRSVLLTPERNCSICYKRVGTAALVAFPSGLLAHYSCYRRTSGGTSGGVGAGGRGAGGMGAGVVPVAAAVGSSFQAWV